MAEAKEITHLGRAANCVCHDLPGPRCPDCNHLLPPQDTNTEAAVKCSVCHTIVSAQQGQDITIHVNDLVTKQKGVFDNGQNHSIKRG